MGCPHFSLALFPLQESGISVEEETEILQVPGLVDDVKETVFPRHNGLTHVLVMRDCIASKDLQRMRMGTKSHPQQEACHLLGKKKNQMFPVEYLSKHTLGWVPCLVVVDQLKTGPLFHCVLFVLFCFVYLVLLAVLFVFIFILEREKDIENMKLRVSEETGRS